MSDIAPIGSCAMVRAFRYPEREMMNVDRHRSFYLSKIWTCESRLSPASCLRLTIVDSESEEQIGNRHHRRYHSRRIWYVLSGMNDIQSTDVI
jgi:hypothetical protein